MGRRSRPGSVHSTVFGSSDGAIQQTGGGYSPRAARLNNGQLWFATNAGVSVVDPAHLPFNKLPPPVHIEQIIADRKVVSDRRLPPLTRDLEIDYTALSLVAPEKNRFKYKLEGHDRDWQDAGNRRQAFYNDLPPRHYRFRVMASNNSGVWNETGDTLEFSIAPAYYQTNWFRASLVAAFFRALGVVPLAPASARAGIQRAIWKAAWTSACASPAICTIRCCRVFRVWFPFSKRRAICFPGEAIGRRKCSTKVSTTRRTRLSRAAMQYRICGRNRRWIPIWVLCSTPPGRNWRNPGGGGECARIPRGRGGTAAAARSTPQGRDLSDRPRSVAQCLPARAREPHRGGNPVRSRHVPATDSR